MKEYAEVRCPVGSRTLLMKLRMDPEASRGVSKDNLVMVMCRECTKHERRVCAKAGLGTSFRIIHCFSFDGEYVETMREGVE